MSYRKSFMRQTTRILILFFFIGLMPALADQQANQLISNYLNQMVRHSATFSIGVEYYVKEKAPIRLSFSWKRWVQQKKVSHLIEMEYPNSEEGKRLLVHEYPNGSSDRFAFRPKSVLKKNVRITGPRHYRYKRLRISVQELIGGELAKYTHHFLEKKRFNNKDCYLIENRLKPLFRNKSDYPRSVIALSVKNQELAQWELYDRDDHLAKLILPGKIKDIDGVRTIISFRITDPRRNSTLIFNVKSVDYHPRFDPIIFKKENLTESVQ